MQRAQHASVSPIACWPYAMHHVMLMANSRLQVAIFQMPSEWSLGIGSATELGRHSVQLQLPQRTKLVALAARALVAA